MKLNDSKCQSFWDISLFWWRPFACSGRPCAYAVRYILHAIRNNVTSVCLSERAPMCVCVCWILLVCVLALSNKRAIRLLNYWVINDSKSKGNRPIASIFNADRNLTCAREHHLKCEAMLRTVLFWYWTCEIHNNLLNWKYLNEFKPIKSNRFSRYMPEHRAIDGLTTSTTGDDDAVNR